MFDILLGLWPGGGTSQFFSPQVWLDPALHPSLWSPQRGYCQCVAFLCFPLCEAEQGITFSVLLLVHYDITFNFFFSTSICAQPSFYSASILLPLVKETHNNPWFYPSRSEKSPQCMVPCMELNPKRPTRARLISPLTCLQQGRAEQRTTSKSTCLQVEAAVPQWDMH